MALSHSFSRHVVEAGEPLILTDVRTDPAMRDNLSIRDFGAVAFAAVPLVDAEGLVLGTLAVMDREPRRWTPSEITLLADLAAVCSSELQLRIAREIADEARRHAESAHDQLTLLGELTEALAATMDIDEALGRLGRIVAGRLADWCLVTLADRATVRHAYAAHGSPAFEPAAARLAGSSSATLLGLVRAVQRSGGPIRGTGARAVAVPHPAIEEIRRLAGGMGFSSYLIVPITAPATQRIIGAVLLVNGPDRAAFSAAEERTSLEIGRRAGLAVDNTRLYGHQRHVAEVLQHSMLPALPEVLGVELSARYLPAEVGAAVGGDWYDAFAQPDGSVMLAVGDVAGHDIEAAATMGQVRNLVRGDAYGRDDEPGRLLSQLDRALHGLQVPAAATAVLARLSRDDEGFRVDFANAGHPPPLLLRPDGEIDIWWVSPEPLLGLVPNDSRATHHRRLPAGSTLLLYTDGLVEHPAQLIDDGIDRIRAVLRGNAGLPAEELGALLVESARRRADDIAFLVVKICEPGRPEK
jgi:GAF domain-containing protein